MIVLGCGSDRVWAGRTGTLLAGVVPEFSSCGKMKRYVLFGGRGLPQGGWYDFLASGESEADVDPVVHIPEAEDLDYRYTFDGRTYDWFQIVDTVEGLPVRSGGCGGAFDL